LVLWFRGEDFLAFKVVSALGSELGFGVRIMGLGFRV
jgi:hypothetical protein